jgi:hypothetical protein
MVFSGDFSPVLAKHSKHFSLEDSLSVGVDVSSAILTRCDGRWKLGGLSS